MAAAKRARRKSQAALSPAKVVTDVYATVPEGELAVLQTDFTNRVAAFLHRRPSSWSRPSRIEVSAVFAAAQDLALTAKDLHKRHGGSGRSRSGPRFDFSFPSYDEFESDVEKAVAMMRRQKTAVLLAAEATKITPRPADGSIPKHFAASDAVAASGMNRWLGKLLAALGVKDVWKAILEVLEGSWSHFLTSLSGAIARRDWGMVSGLLGDILKVMVSRPFLVELGEKIGVKAAARVVGKIVAKAVPLLGWGLLIGSLLWAIAEEFI